MSEKSQEILAIEKVAEQVKSFQTSLGEKADKGQFDAVIKQIEDLKKGLGEWDGKKIEDSMKSINDAIVKFGKQMGEMAEDVAKSKESGKAKRKGVFVSTEDVKKFIEDTFKDGAKTGNKASIKMAPMVSKAAETFGYPQFFEGGADTVTDAFTGRFIDPTLYQRKRKRNLILDNFPIETITVPKLIFLVKVEVSGDDASSENTGSADWIVSGGQKPMRSFRVTTGEAEAKKVAIFGTVEDKLLRDVPSLENWIREDFTAEMREAYNDALLNNNPGTDPDAPLGLKQNAIQYAGSDAFDEAILDPNEIDAIVAAAAYMSTLHEEPAMAFVSSDVWYKIHILKDNDARYQNNTMVYTNALGELYIAGVHVIQADSEDVPSTHLLLVGAELGFKIKNYGPMVFERGLNGEDFRYDRTSYRGYQEVLAYIAEHRYNSVLYDTFANIFAFIEASGS